MSEQVLLLGYGGFRYVDRADVPSGYVIVHPHIDHFHKLSRPVDQPTNEGQDMQPLDIDNTFMHHPPTDQHTVHRHEQVRAKAADFAKFVQENTAPSREQSTAITKIQEAMMWANAAVAIHDEQFRGVASQGEAVGNVPAPAPEQTGDVDPGDIGAADLEPEPGAEDEGSPLKENPDIDTVPLTKREDGIDMPEERTPLFKEPEAEDTAKGDKGTGAPSAASYTGGDLVQYDTGETSGLAEVIEVVGDDVKLRFDTGLEGTVKLAQVRAVE